MTNYYKNFYQDLYKKTDGYIPLWPLMTEAELGDLILIRHGQMVKVGNILNEFFGIHEEVSLEAEWSSSSDSWDIQAGVHHSFISKDYNSDTAIPDEKSGLLLKFDFPGAYFFHAPEVRHRSIENFYEFQFKLLQRLATEKCSFSEIFVVTSVAKTPIFSLMIANDSDAHILMSFPDDGSTPYSFNELTGTDGSATITDMKSIHSCRLNHQGGQFFFKAQKLECSVQGKDLIKRYINQFLPESMQEQAKNILKFTPSQMLPSIEIYPARVHELFHFRELNLDDVLDFFGKQ